MEDSTPIWLNGREIGEITADGSFQKRLHSSKHFLQVPPAIGFADTTIEQARAAGALGFRIIDRDTKKIYQVSLETFDRHCFPVHRGAEKQHALRLDWWEVSGGRQTGDANKALDQYYKRQGKKNEPTQPTLWGGL